MNTDIDGGFGGLIALHRRLVLDPEADAPGTALYPRAVSPERWRPTFERMPYRPADPSTLGLGGTDSFHDLTDERVRTAILRVVDDEGPVHFNLLGDRLLTAAGVGRMGSRIRARIEAMLEVLEDEGEIVRLAAFSGRHRQFLRPRLRDWSPLPDRERKLEHVADSELMLCLFHAVLDDEGIDADTAMNDGLYRIGFIRLTDNARERLQSPLQALLDRGMLRLADGRLWVGLHAFVR